MDITPAQEEAFIEWWLARGKGAPSGFVYLRYLKRMPAEGSLVERASVIPEGSRGVAAAAIQAWDAFSLRPKDGETKSEATPAPSANVYDDFQTWLGGALNNARIASHARGQLQSSLTLGGEIPTRVLGWWLRFCATHDKSPEPHLPLYPRWVIHAAWLVGTAIHDFALVNSGSGDIVWDRAVKFATGKGWPEAVGGLDFANFVRPTTPDFKQTAMTPLDFVMPNGKRLPDLWGLWGPPLFKLAVFSGFDPAAVSYPKEPTKPGAQGPLLPRDGKAIGPELLKLYFEALAPFSPSEVYSEVPTRVLEVAVRYQQEVAMFMGARKSVPPPPLGLVPVSCVAGVMR